MKRTVRSAAIAAVAVLAVGAATGCQSSSSGSAQGNPFVPDGGGGQSAGGSTGGVGTASGGSASVGSTSGGAAGGAPSQSWVVSAPDTLIGLARVQPSASLLQTITTLLQQSDAPMGVTGTPVIGVYDYPKYDVYVVFAGVNGSGLDPAKLTTAFTSAPRISDDGTGDTETHNDVIIDPGDHGGTAGCASDTTKNNYVVYESTICAWMTQTTFGSVTYIPKPDHQMLVVGTGPEVIGPSMRSVRAQVEHQG